MTGPRIQRFCCCYWRFLGFPYFSELRYQEASCASSSLARWSPAKARHCGATDAAWVPCSQPCSSKFFPSLTWCSAQGSLGFCSASGSNRQSQSWSCWVHTFCTAKQGIFLAICSYQYASQLPRSRPWFSSGNDFTRPWFFPSGPSRWSSLTGASLSPQQSALGSSLLCWSAITPSAWC